MNTIELFGFNELTGPEMVSVTGGEPRTFWYRVGQVAAETAEFFVGVWDGLTGK